MRKKLILAVFALPAVSLGQTLIEAPDFYNPDFRARRPGSSGVIALTVNNAVYTQSQSSGDVSWTHGAGGFAEVDTGLAGVELAAYTETTGDQLVFGRELTTSGLASALGPLLTSVVGASVLSTWSSQAVVSNLAIVPDQLYEVHFNVASGDGLPVGLLDTLTFGITNPEISGGGGSSAELLDLLGLLSIGTSASDSDYTFQFTSSQALDSLTFSFDATSLVSLGLLGTASGNQDVLTFSGFEVVAVPEPGTISLAAVGALLLLKRSRSRC
ncbi:hypothetical protein JIN85_02615 [Luteolibacter pohnpeiensis]|uniref:PEP-CTERM protein-sorting domain-containing protein n=1 Tax=Luteolibacter pohnpeiensis TaxID=454153 RepID=A0A934S8G3_9BACT|nr:hypothetical protein [Luteolibacter pohnpeiensis]MBK1881289.1 hypothetical protein [Luteolibacter pohnpeiensis]